MTRLSETHRRTLGARLATMQTLIIHVRDVGFDSDSLEELEAGVARIEQHVQALRPTPPSHEARASLAQLLVLAYEIRPGALRAHGEVAEEDAPYLEQASEGLARLVKRALDELERQSALEVNDHAVPEDPRRNRR